MSIDLSSYASIGCGLFARIEVAYYKQNPEDTATSTVLRFSDYYKNITIDGETYLGLGQLVGITSTRSEIKTSFSGLTISISGIPNTSIAQIVNSRIKGCPIQVYRYVFDAETGLPLDIDGNPAGRFFGTISNYSLQETYDIDNRVSSNTIVLDCKSLVEILDNKVVGRKTNPTSQKALYPNDLSMDRVPSLVGANFNFGAPE